MDSLRHLVEGPPRGKFKVASQFQHSLKKDMLRRSNQVTGGNLLTQTCRMARGRG
jgi:hypothetical protein